MVAKTSIMSIANYAASVSAVSSKEIKQLESKLFKFIWEGRNDKVRRAVTALPKMEGGIGAPFPRAIIDALHLQLWGKSKRCCFEKW